MIIRTTKRFIDKFTKKDVEIGAVMEVDAVRGADIIARGLGTEQKADRPQRGGKVKTENLPDAPIPETDGQADA